MKHLLKFRSDYFNQKGRSRSTEEEAIDLAPRALKITIFRSLLKNIFEFCLLVLIPSGKKYLLKIKEIIQWKL